MPFYSSHPAAGCLFNNLKVLLDAKNLSSFALSKLADLSPTTTRRIYLDTNYIPSPDVLEKLCLSLYCNPGDLLGITSKLGLSVTVCSGV
jgi:DNA-binding Xre family transcriptional regulator